MVEAWLIQYRDTEILLRIIGLRHLQECINLTDSGNVVRDEWLHLGVELNLLRFVPLNVLKHFLDFLRNWQVCILVGIVSARNLLLVLVILVIFLLGALLHLLLHLLLASLLLLLLSLRLNVDVDVNFVFFLIRVDLLGVIDIDCKIERLVFNFVTFHICRLLIGLGARCLS